MSQNEVKNLARKVTMIAPIEQEQASRIRYAAYVRVSSSSEEQLNSYTQQISHYSRMFREKEDECELVDIYADEGVSGTSIAKRLDFQRMLNDARRGKIDRIITKNLSRFSRDTVVTLEAIRELSALGVAVYFEDENIDTSVVSTEIILSLHGMIAEESSRIISSNGRNSFHKKAIAGEYIMAVAPYGFKKVNGTLEIHPQESVIVQKIFNDYLSGCGMADIARTLTECKVPPPTGKKIWHHTTIRNILTNERMMGDTVLNKRFSIDTFPYKRKVNTGEVDLYYMDESHPGIVDRETFMAAQKIVESKKKNLDNRGNHTFNSMFKCGACGKAMRRKISNDIPYWVCGFQNAHQSDCNIPPIPESEIELAFARMYNKLLDSKEQMLLPMIEMLTNLYVKKNSNNENLQSISTELAELASKSNMINSLRAKGLVDNDYCIKEQTKINQDIHNLKRSKEQIINSIDDDDTLITSKMLLTLLDKKLSLDNFDATKFKSVVAGIKTGRDDTIIFQLINHLEITEKIERNTR